MKNRLKKEQEVPEEKKAKVPVVDIVVRFDPRDGEISIVVIGANIEPMVAYEILESAKKRILASVAQKPEEEVKPEV